MHPQIKKFLQNAMAKIPQLKALGTKMNSLNNIDHNTNLSKIYLTNAIGNTERILAQPDEGDIYNKKLGTKFYDLVMMELIQALHVLSKSSQHDLKECKEQMLLHNSEEEVKKHAEQIAIISDALYLCNLIKMDLDNYLG